MTDASYAIAIAVALVFATAAARHVAEPWRIGSVLASMGVAGGLAPIAVAAEAALVPLLVVAPRLGGWVGAADVLVVTGAMAAVVARGNRIEDCGCRKSAHPVDRSYFARNIALGAACGVVAGFGAAGSPWQAIVVSIVAAGAVGVRFHVLARRHRARLSSRSERLGT